MYLNRPTRENSIQTYEVLKQLGWSDFFEPAREQSALAYDQIGRVIIEHKTEYILATGAGETRGKVSGAMLHEAEFPKVGDWVGFAASPDKSDDFVLIKTIFPRQSALSRRVVNESSQQQIIATNINTIFIVQGLDNNYNPRRIERSMVIVETSGAKPVIVLTKADVAESLEERKVEIEELFPGVTVLTINATDKDEVMQLLEYIKPGETAALIGSSGVGKSTIVNSLSSIEKMKVGEVRETDSKGRHTTTHRELVQLANGGLLIDTPGMRELGIQEHDTPDDLFEDIIELTHQCRFSNCQHDSEPGCAIQLALADGSLEMGRWESYLKLQREQEHAVTKIQPMAAIDRKREAKKIQKEFNKIVRDQD